LHGCMVGQQKPTCVAGSTPKCVEKVFLLRTGQVEFPLLHASRMRERNSSNKQCGKHLFSPFLVANSPPHFCLILFSPHILALIRVAYKPCNHAAMQHSDVLRVIFQRFLSAGRSTEGVFLLLPRLPLQLSFDQQIQVAVENSRSVAGFVVGPDVLDHLVRV